MVQVASAYGIVEFKDVTESVAYVRSGTTTVVITAEVLPPGHILRRRVVSRGSTGPK